MKLKRIIAVCVVAIMCMSLMTACNEKKESSNTIDTLVWYVPGVEQTDIASVMEEANKIVEPELGIKLDLRFIDEGAYSEKMTMMMAGGEEFDLLHSGYRIKIADTAKKGGLMALDELIEQYTPNLKSMLPEAAWNDVMVNDEIYAVPNEQIWGVNYCYSVRKDMAEKYNFDVSKVTCFEDLEPFLEKIRDNEKDVFPFSPSGSIFTKEFAKERFRLNRLAGESVMFSEKTGKVYAYYDIPYKLENLKFHHSWYEKGFIRKDIATLKDGSTDQKLGKNIVTYDLYKPGMEMTLKASRNGYDYAISDMSNASPFISAGHISATSLSISATSKHPVESIKLIELLNTNKELYNLICFGVEGKHYKKTGENRIELIENSGYYHPSDSWKYGNQFNAYILPEQTDDVWEKTKEINNRATASKLMGFQLDTSAVKTELAQISKLNSQYIVSIFNTGAEDPEKYWDEFEKKLKEAGVEKVVAEYQRQIDEFLAK